MCFGDVLRTSQYVVDAGPAPRWTFGQGEISYGPALNLNWIAEVGQLQGFSFAASLYLGFVRNVSWVPGCQIYRPEPLSECRKSFLRKCPRRLWVACILRPLIRDMAIVLNKFTKAFGEFSIGPFVPPGPTHTAIWHRMLINGQAIHNQVNDQTCRLPKNNEVPYRGSDFKRDPCVMKLERITRGLVQSLVNELFKAEPCEPPEVLHSCLIGILRCKGKVFNECHANQIRRCVMR